MNLFVLVQISECEKISLRYLSLLIVFVALQPVRCSLHPHQKQNSPSACHRPSHGECTLYSHTQEDPQVPPALCESKHTCFISLFVNECLINLNMRKWWAIVIHSAETYEVPLIYVPLSFLCCPLVVNVEINSLAVFFWWLLWKGDHP